MAVIVLFLLSSVLVFSNTEPFTTAGIFLIICYFPGLCAFALSKRDELLFEDLILAAPASIGISCMLILVLLFCGTNVKYIPAIIHIIVGVAVAVCTIVKNRNRAYTAIRVNKQEILFSLFALAATLILSIPYFLGPDRVTIASHVFHHSSLVTQIINGIFPPENPGLGGTIIGYYWGFHAFIAALTVKTGYQQAQINFVLNALSIYMIFCTAYCFAKALDMSEVYRYILPLAVIGLMRLDAGAIFLMKLFSGNLTPVEEITIYPLHPSNVLAVWLDGLSWLETRLLFIRKFYNVTGMPLAVSLSFSYLLLLLLMLKRECSKNNIYMVVTGIVIFACLFNYPPLAIFLLLHAPVWICYLFFVTKGNVKEKVRETLKVALPYVTAILVVSPYLLFVVKSRGVSSSGQGSIFSFDLYEQSIKNMVVFLLPFPVIISGAWIAFKKLSFSREFIFLLIGTSISLCLSVITRWPFDNSYKFNYVLTFFFAVLFVFALSAWLPLIVKHWLKRLVTAGIIFFIFLSPLTIVVAYIGTSFQTEYRYAFSGKHFIYAQDKLKNEAYEWIRKNTPEDALIMLSYVETPWPCCGINNNYEVAAIAERNLYAIKDTDYTTSNPEYAKRIKFRERFFENPKDPSAADFFRSLNRPIYLLVEEDLPDDRFWVEERFKPFPEDPGEAFNLLFRNERQRVYLLQNN